MLSIRLQMTFFLLLPTLHICMQCHQKLNEKDKNICLIAPLNDAVVHLLVNRIVNIYRVLFS